MPGTLDLRDSPTAWFALLERAKRTGDRELADRARRELERLGVHVTFDRGDLSDKQEARRA
jgi:hypothetical protein